MNVSSVLTKVPEAPHDVPASIEVLTDVDLRNLGAHTLRDALALAAGVEIAPGSDQGPAGSVPEFWGLREFDAFLLLVDDVPWGGAFNPALTSLSLRDVERIEIVRGAAPVTYGATSFVGVINVVHKGAAVTERYLSANLGTLGSGGAAVDFALPMQGPWKARLTADFDRQGFADDRTSYGRGHALFRMGKSEADRRMWFTADVNILRQDPASPHPREGSALSTNVPLDANYNPDGAFLNENRIAVNFGTERPFRTDLKLAILASFTHTGQDQFRGFIANIANASDNANGLRETIDQNDIYVDAHLIWPERNKLTYVAGVDFLHGNGDAKGQTFTYTVPLGGVPPTVVPQPADLPLGSEDRREFIGGYGLAEWKPNARTRVSGGLRLNMTFEEGGEGENEATKPAGEKDEGATHVRLSGNVGVLYNLWEQGANHVRVFGNYRNTFKPAAFDFGLGEGEGEETEGALLDPETAQSVEGGIKARTMDGKVDLEASVFHMDFHNLVTSTIENGVPALTNTGKTRFQGVELAAGVRLQHAVTGRLTYSFHDGKFVDFVQAFDGEPQQLGGNRFEMSARHLLSAGVILAPEDGVFGSLVVKYTGDRYLDKRNSALADPFATVDFGVGFRRNQYELRFDARNVGDRRDPISESELGDAQYYLMMSREFRFSIGYRF